MFQYMRDKKGEPVRLVYLLIFLGKYADKLALTTTTEHRRDVTVIRWDELTTTAIIYDSWVEEGVTATVQWTALPQTPPSVKQLDKSGLCWQTEKTSVLGVRKPQLFA